MLCLHVCVYTMWMQSWGRGRKGAPESLELELEKAGFLWGMEPGFSARAANAVNYWVISLVLRFEFLCGCWGWELRSSSWTETTLPTYSSAFINLVLIQQNKIGFSVFKDLLVQSLTASWRTVKLWRHRRWHDKPPCVWRDRVGKGDWSLLSLWELKQNQVSSSCTWGVLEALSGQEKAAGGWWNRNKDYWLVGFCGRQDLAYSWRVDHGGGFNPEVRPGWKS